MPKRSGSASFPVGVYHRRVFPTWINGNGLTTASSAPNLITWGAAAFSNTAILDLGIDALPRSPGKVWAVEVLKINYQFYDAASSNTITQSAVCDYGFVLGVSTNNSPATTSYVASNPGIVNLWRVDSIIDATAYHREAPTATSVGFQTGFRSEEDMHVEHDLTDTSGTGVLCFTNNLYLIAHSFAAASAASASVNLPATVFCIPEVFFRYVQVPLEYYLSKQEDLAASGI